jgi:S1-C subfamily serine protease
MQYFINAAFYVRRIPMRLVIAFLLLCSMSVVAEGGKPLSLPDAIEMVSPSVVAIQCVFDNLPKQTSEVLRSPFYRWVCGTGFIVSDAGYVITALHVIEGFESTTTILQDATQYPLGPGRLVAGLSLHVDSPGIQVRESTFNVQMAVVDRNKKHDIALLKMTHGPFIHGAPIVVTGREQVDAPVPAVILFDVARPREGEAVAVSGFPLSELAMKTNSGTIASSWATDKNQRPGVLVDSYVTDMRVNPGDSGAPVYSVASGAVIGICDSFDVD